MTFKNPAATFLLLIILTSCTTKTDIKYNPGHYISVLPRTEMSEIKHIHESSIKGVQKRYHWRRLEPQKGQYDFSEIERDLCLLAENNKQLIVFIIDFSYWKRSALPEYLSEFDSQSEYGGFHPVRWHPEVVDRFIELGKALGEKFDTNPNFEGIATQETSIEISDEGFEKYHYTADKHRDAITDVLIGLQNAMPNSHIFWYQNFLEGNDGHLRQIADTILDYGIFMGGPDILPYRIAIRDETYPMFEEYQDKLVLFCSAQDCSYKHHKGDLRLQEIEPVHSDGYLTMEEIFLYGRDSLHIQYMFWNCYYDGADKGHRSFDDAIKVVNKYPTFNEINE